MAPTQGSPQLGVMFYPGARVDARAYAHLLRPVAEAGFQVVIAKEPLGIAFLASGFAASWVDSHPDVGTWVVGGHSLGGVVASTNADAEPKIDGLMLWASFPASNISDAAISATSISGTNDGLSTPEKIAESVPDLPPDTIFVPIEGAIHSYFGDYGLQSGDGVPGVPRDVAQAEIVDAMMQFLNSLR
jgi:Alpha/beta hydrolase family